MSAEISKKAFDLETGASLAGWDQADRRQNNEFCPDEDHPFCLSGGFCARAITRSCSQVVAICSQRALGLCKKRLQLSR